MRQYRHSTDPRYRRRGLDPIGWQPLMQRQAAEFRAKGMAATYRRKGTAHRSDTLAGPNVAWLFDLFEQANHGCGK
jgi:hypothetical protein